MWKLIISRYSANCTQQSTESAAENAAQAAELQEREVQERTGYVPCGYTE